MAKKKGNTESKITKKILIELLISVFLIILLALGSKFGIIDNIDNIDDSNNIDNIDNTSIENIESNISNEKGKIEDLTNVELKNEDLKIYYIDVGQADSILIQNNEKTLLIDAGNNEDGKNIVKFIQNLGINKINYLVGTHPHEDHIGGLDNVINSFEIENILMPKVQTNTKTFEDVLDSISNKGLNITSPKKGDKFMLEEAECEIMLSEENSKNLNNSSIVIRLVLKDQSYIFMGDTEKDNEALRSWPQTNVIKIGHHGSNTSTSADFIKQISPQIAIIMVGKDNKYGHPKDEIIERINSTNAKIYRTDEQGNILIISDGENNKVVKYLED